MLGNTRDRTPANHHAPQARRRGDEGGGTPPQHRERHRLHTDSDQVDGINASGLARDATTSGIAATSRAPDPGKA